MDLHERVEPASPDDRHVGEPPGGRQPRGSPRRPDRADRRTSTGRPNGEDWTTGPGTARRPEGCQRIALVLQGGGALGAYQAGVYQALHEEGYLPDWLSGVSIGAINSAIIAGNPPERRLERLHTFWDRITSGALPFWTPDGDDWRRLRNQLAAWQAMALGQPGFFAPRPVNPWLQPTGAKGAIGFYDNAPLRETLLELVDFDLINSRQVRLSVGAVNVRLGNFVYFDNFRQPIGPEHIMASGALPPAFAPVKVDGEYYWDGGIVSNTPLQYLLKMDEGLATLVFQVDLFSNEGPLPRDMANVLARHKDITYSSRTRYTTDVYRRIHDLKQQIRDLLREKPEASLTEAQRELLAEVERSGSFSIVQLVYQQRAHEGEAKDYEFSPTSMREHWAVGYEDTARSLRCPEFFRLPEGTAIKTHDVHRIRDEGTMSGLAWAGVAGRLSHSRPEEVR
jgi:NTE family protein